MTPDERDVRALHATWIEAVNAGDLPRLLELLADDAVLFSPGQPPFGRERFAETFSAAHGQWRIRCVSPKRSPSPATWPSRDAGIRCP
ncbi:MAG: SgcJ/EcaC family oxidoreductase [Candidatus Eisenbacteria bacterium]|uniref:SgcJ/EcaC family oxidoreductase n=1 Tax=Eiseniibacteriota bacterium TaxID=2212470 RepID=A0A933SBP5_UNCEI|nr:SgcJ/EcaC family oxidoreductase [Candidatus Eisenbacteria bacterium]